MNHINESGFIILNMGEKLSFIWFILFHSVYLCFYKEVSIRIVFYYFKTDIRLYRLFEYSALSAWLNRSSILISGSQENSDTPTLISI